MRYENVIPVYTDCKYPTEVEKSIFLAGPFAFREDGSSWRDDALEYLDKTGFNGHVYLPYNPDKTFPEYFEDQRKWEIGALNRCDCIVFWVPRNMKTVTALDTNVEFGLYVKQKKCVLGCPTDAERVDYLQNTIAGYDGVSLYDLKDTLDAAIAFIGKGSKRMGGASAIPAIIYQTKECQEWYKSLIESGNELKEFVLEDVLYSSYGDVFSWTASTEIQNNRDKIRKREYVTSRGSTCSCVIYSKNKSDILKSKVVLVKECRNTANNEESIIYNLPGGGGNESVLDMNTVIKEVKEETGLEIHTEDIYLDSIRQNDSVFSLHKDTLYSCEVSQARMAEIKATVEGNICGVFENAEFTEVIVMTYADILQNKCIDWAVIGKISKVLNSDKAYNF